MARKYKSRVTTDKLDAKIEQQKEALEKAKARYEAEKDALAELVKMRNELRKEELMNAVINSDKSWLFWGDGGLKVPSTPVFS